MKNKKIMLKNIKKSIIIKKSIKCNINLKTKFMNLKYYFKELEFKGP